MAVSGLTGATAVSAGWDHTCAVLGDGTARCWGDNGLGQLGNRTSSSYSSTPVTVYGLERVVAISAGYKHTCAVLAGGAVECWGLNYGPREVPSEAPSSSPTSRAPHASPSPPRVRITSHPPAETVDQRAVFTFTGAPGGTYACSVDAGRWRRCRSGEDFGPLLPGDHGFSVRQTLNGLTGPADSYAWTIALPRACVLRVARARVFVHAQKQRARLVIRYKTYRPAEVTVTYELVGGRGNLALGRATSRFKTAGLFRLAKPLGPTEMRKVRSARHFKLRFRIPGTPGSCARFYTKQLTIPKRIGGQKVWFQSDSIFGIGWGS